MYPMKSTTPEATAIKLRETLSKYGFQTILVFNNEPQFVLEEYKTFVTRNGMHYVTSAPYHPSTNGLTGRFVQSLKQGLRKNNRLTISEAVEVFVLAQEHTPFNKERAAVTSDV